MSPSYVGRTVVRSFIVPVIMIQPTGMSELTAIYRQSL